MPEAADELELLSHALSVVGDRWTLVVIGGLLDGPQRYGDLQARVPGIAPNILAARLKRLAAEGVVSARAYQERPPRYLYELADGGRELAGAVRLLAEWGARPGRGGPPPPPPPPPPGGSLLEPRGSARGCRRPTDTAGLEPPPDDGVFFA